MKHFNRNKYQEGSINTVKMVCASFCCIFSFAWLFWFQADLMTVAQHVLSGGTTHYDRTVGAILITLVLQLLQVVVSAVVPQNGRSHALTYLPSMLLLAFIGDMSASVALQTSMGSWLWLAPLVLVLWGGACWLCKNRLPFDQDKECNGVFSRCVWINMLAMCAMMLCVVALSNTNAVLHHRAHAEVALSRGEADEALRTGKRSLETDEHLTMLRIFALASRRQLGEKLFNYPIAGSSSDMLPAMSNSRSRLMLLPADSIWRTLGARPAQGMSTAQYLKAVSRDTLAKPVVADYVLCGHLLDRQLDAFVSVLPRFYNVSDTAAHALPLHYREALILYVHRKANPAIVYHNTVMDEDWENLQELEKQYPLYTDRKAHVFERYGESYWYYYLYGNK